MMKKAKRRKRYQVQGVQVSRGVAIGSVYTLQPRQSVVQRKVIRKGDVEKEVRRFKKALLVAKREILSVKKKLLKRVGEYEAKIFDAHVLILEDPEILKAVINSIREEQRNAEYAFNHEMSSLIRQFDSVTDQYLKERISDIRNVSSRVLALLQSNTPQINIETSSPVILMAKEIPPYALGEINKENMLGFITELGGKTSHFSILARSVEVPAVTGISVSSLNIADDELVILDGNKGLLIVNPTAKEIATYEAKCIAYANLEEQLLDVMDLESKTSDEQSINLLANIELPTDLDKVIQYGANGVGLFRSEFLLLASKEIPSEEQQYEVYKKIAERMHPKEVTIRTFDSGGDKLVPGIHEDEELNPFMGWRSIRVCLDKPLLFKDQLRAILRASVEKNLKIMFPMISDVQEFMKAKELLIQAMDELKSHEVAYDPHIKVGCMIEVPSAVILVNELAEVCDFFSIGSNDLIQFTLAVDRGNEKIAKMFEPHHPSVLKMIEMVVQAAQKKEISVSVCGEMAGDPFSALLLLGMGVDELSMRAGSILEVRKFFRKISMQEAKDVWEKVRLLSSASEINSYLQTHYESVLNSLQLPQYQN